MVFGVILVSPDSLLVRLAEKVSPPYTLLLWRQVFVAITQVVATLGYCGGWRPALAQADKSGVYFWASIPMQAAGAICIALAFTMTSAANALILFYLQPLWAAMGSVLYFKDPLPRRTIVAVAVGLAAAVAVFLGSRSNGEDTTAKSSTAGDILALVAGIAYASYFMICRACALAVGPETEMLPGSAAGMVLSVFVSLLLAWDEILAIDNGIFWLWVFLNGCIVIGGAVLWMTVAMKYILPPESALIGLLELALGPIWVFFGIGEVPSVWTIVAGVVLLCTLGGHEYLGMKESSGPDPTMTSVFVNEASDVVTLLGNSESDEEDEFTVDGSTV